MAEKVKEYSFHKEFVDANGQKHTVLVYGELRFTKVNIFGKRQQYKELNFGHAICSEGDQFDVETGIKLAKKRFYRDPLGTLNHNFLNEDMVNALLVNEVEYIAKHIERYLPKKN